MKTFEMYVDNLRFVHVNFSLSAELLGTTVSSVVWAIQEGSSVSLGEQILAGNVAQTAISTSQRDGCNLIKCVATLANDAVISAYFRINVINPSCCGGSNDYR